MPWAREQKRNAKTIIGVGQQMHMSPRDIQIALMTAIVESNLYNVHHGDGSSLGLFQQIDSWGSAENRTNPVWSTRKFFNSLKQVDRNGMGLGEAAQAVQRSAFPDRYAEHTQEAARLLNHFGDADMGDLSTLGGVTPTSSFADPFGDPNAVTTDFAAPGEGLVSDPLAKITTPGDGRMVAQYNANLGESRSPVSQAETFGGLNTWMGNMQMPDLSSFGVDPHIQGTSRGPGGTDMSHVEGWRRKVVKFAQSMLGQPYVWGGTSKSGVDCSGLVLLAMQRAGISMPRISADQARTGRRVGFGDLKPGDLVAWDNSSRNNGADHIAIYIGHGRIIEAPRPGSSVQVSKIYDKGQAWGVRIGGN